MRIQMSFSKYDDEEIRDLIYKDLEKYNGKDEEMNGNLAKSCFYSIIENYISDSPGFCGDILTVVFGYPEAIHNYTLKNGELEKIYPTISMINNSEPDKHGFTDLDIIDIYREYLEYGFVESCWDDEEMKHIKGRFINLLKE